MQIFQIFQYIKKLCEHVVLEIKRSHESNLVINFLTMETIIPKFVLLAFNAVKLRISIEFTVTFIITFIKFTPSIYINITLKYHMIIFFVGNG
ncbi:hypothetical protein C2G38_2054600 [Gigaspora rosea]|uniref:Uncharacterized protein n=1 Tax=Gigaspora rosea TaxID=44941 RepID=A0A397W658_9GLOM|nr:hypothetical protein C2G38_2054600 [Gigaspora rosea]